MNLSKQKLPDTVIVDGSVYKIKTAHYWWFLFAEILDQREVPLYEFDKFYDCEPPEDRQAGVDQLLLFYYEPKELPRAEGDGEKVLDFAIDADLIYAALYQCYGVDLYEKEYHWHKVRAMISGVTGTKLNEVLGYRCVNPGKNKELAKGKAMWALPEKEIELKQFENVFYNAQF